MNTRTTTAARGRPRRPEVQETLLRAARELLAQGGFEGLTFENLSQATGITRPTIYRRWPTKAHLVAEIANGAGDQAMPDVIEAEGAEAQIRLVLEQVLAQYGRPEMPAAMTGLLSLYFSDPTLRDRFHTPIETRAREEFRAIIAKGQRSGEIRSDVESDTLFDTMVGAVMFRAVLSSSPPPPGYLETLARQVIEGVRTV